MHSTPTRANIPLPSLPPLNLERSIRRGFGINIESRGGKEEGGIDVNTPSTVVTGGKQDALSLTRLPISFTPFEERNRRPLLVCISLSLSPKFNRCSCYEIARDRAIFRFSRISRLFYTCNSRIFGRIGATRSLQSRAPRPPIPPRARGEGRSHSSPTPSLPSIAFRRG